MIIPRTRLAGLLFLLPMIFNIFLMHVFFDNRIDENILTGSLLALNLILCSYYYKRIQLILLEKNK
jgi:hypothetical protein